MKALKKILAITLVAAMIFACGCDNTSTSKESSESEETQEIIDLTGKKILICGNSFTYIGGCVEESKLKQTFEERQNDQGYFYQLCKANGMEPLVTNWTFGGHGMEDIFSELFGHDCEKVDSTHCSEGTNHYPDLTDRVYDYVVFQGTRYVEPGLELPYVLSVIMEEFRKYNPDVKFLITVPERSYGQVGEDGEYCQAETTENLKIIEAMGVEIVDWGRLCFEVWHQDVEVPGATQEYSETSFVVARTKKDGYHENLLAGYITALMLYSVMTGEQAEGQPYDFCDDHSDSKRFFRAFTASHYCVASSNYEDIFASESDMLGLQQLADRYIKEKAFRNEHVTTGVPFVDYYMLDDDDQPISGVTAENYEWMLQAASVYKTLTEEQRVATDAKMSELGMKAFSEFAADAEKIAAEESEKASSEESESAEESESTEESASAEESESAEESASVEDTSREEKTSSSTEASSKETVTKTETETEKESETQSKTESKESQTSEETTSSATKSNGIELPEDEF